MTISLASGGSRRPSAPARTWSSTTRPLATLGGGYACSSRSTAPSRGSCTMTLGSFAMLGSFVMARQPIAEPAQAAGARQRSALRPVPGGEDNLARPIGTDAELFRYLVRPEPLLVVNEREPFLPRRPRAGGRCGLGGRLFRPRPGAPGRGP